ncbi:hypothetical protein EV121DRAFT_200050 [Schizophyllum commune]
MAGPSGSLDPPKSVSPPSVLSTSTLNHSVSTRSNAGPRVNASKVVTAPPWARDEPPSPSSSVTNFDVSQPLQNSASRPSFDVVSFNSAKDASRWWTFTLPRPRDQHPPTQPKPKLSIDTAVGDPEKGTHTPPRRPWLPNTASLNAVRRGDKGKEMAHTGSLSERKNVKLNVELPPPPAAPFTLSHNPTPGWDTPWTARARDDSFGLTGDSTDEDLPRRGRGGKLPKRWRTFLLNNVYVPLLFRFINVTFTSAALAFAIRIRQLEKQNHALGALGSSPTLVIIFSPLTIVHVLIAVYLEYFGRPLGLWRTSGKLFHTLTEVVFICAWSGALSLCFDNFFTSLIPCASASSSDWYNELPRPASPLPNFEGSAGDRLCEDQLTLIILVGVGLIMYCINLVISLFRIFEKVKVHSGAGVLGFS